MINLIIETLQYTEDDLKSVQKVAKTYPIVSTKFPDGTSQVWKLPQEAIDDIGDACSLTIDWRFKEERELFDLLSLWALIAEEIKGLFAKGDQVVNMQTKKSSLFKDYSAPYPIYLKIPYFPFARQDKEISNGCTFNLAVFFQMLNVMEKFPLISKATHDFYKPLTVKVKCFDIHSRALKELNKTEFDTFNDYTNIQTNEKFSDSVDTTFTDFVCLQADWQAIILPDTSAMSRYYVHNGRIPFFAFSKFRNCETGEILNMELQSSFSTFLNSSVEFGSEHKNVLIVDDICDGGATFIKCAEILKKANPNIERLGLRVSHGIFSKGLKPLKDAGYTDIFYTDSLDPSFDKEIPEGLNVVKFKL